MLFEYCLWGSGTLGKFMANIFNVNSNIPRDNADTSNEKEKSSRLKLMVFNSNRYLN